MDERLEKIVQAMTLAPLAHNTQPWRFKPGRSSVDVLAAAVESGEAIRKQLQAAAGTDLLPQMVVRVGHAKKMQLRATPRRSVENCLVGQAKL